MKSCAKSKGIPLDRLVTLMRESKKDNLSTEDKATCSSGGDGSSSSSSARVEGEGESEGAIIESRRSKRLAGQSVGERKQLSKAVETANVSRGDNDFTMAPPGSRPTAGKRRGRKRKRNDLQDKLVPLYSC